MTKNITETVLTLLNKNEDELDEIYITAKLNEILAYLNRTDVTDEMFPLVCTVIADSLRNDIFGSNVQSYHEGDMSISFSNSSPFFGRLDAFKVIRGMK